MRPGPKIRLPHERGPFDVIGDIHGCYDELVELLSKLGYQEKDSWRHPGKRRVVFLGDFIDRGPKIVPSLKLAMQLVKNRKALALMGNHENKLLRYFKGRNIKISEDLQKTIDELESESEEFRRELYEFLRSLSSHLVLDGGKLIVAHAGLEERHHRSPSPAARDLALYGVTTGETDEEGYPIRLDWAEKYQGKAKVIYGHTPVKEAFWKNNTINIDTGCVFGHKLTALRYPENEIAQVPAKKQYASRKNFP